jgi:hypothetical protein
MTRIHSTRSFITVLAVLALAAAALVVAIALPSEASARAESRIEPIADAPIVPQLKAGISTAAQQVGGSGVQEVAADGVSTADRAGIAVTHTAAGTELLAFFTPHSFTDFHSAASATATTPLLVQASITAASDGSTGHVDIMGVVTRSVHSVTIQLASGASLEADLVNAGGGFSYFAYSTSTPSSFPQSVEAFDANGNQVAGHNLTTDIAPPVSAG